MYLTMNGGSADDRIVRHIDAALAEPVVASRLSARDALYRRMCEDREFWERWEDGSRQAERERDEARAEVERLRNALAAISLDEYESTSSASEKVHGHARIARKALHGEKP